MQTLATLVFVFSLFSWDVAANNRRAERKASLRSSANAANGQRELRNAMAEALGCGGHIGSVQMQAIKDTLGKIWHAIPKNSRGRVERRSLRYLVQRYFSQKWSLMIRGFEPSQPANSTGWGSDDILSKRVPAYVEGVLESRHKQENGFDLQDAAFTVATIEELIFDAESALLEQVYVDQRKPLGNSIAEVGFQQLLEGYMIRWMLGQDEEGILMIMNKSLPVTEIIPNWSLVTDFAHGKIQDLNFQRQQQAATASRPGHNAFSRRYSFDDVHTVVGGITKSFASFWQSECDMMKGLLLGMDTHNTGRVPLSKFYGTALDSEWRFGESESYLRDLGALDETSSWYGKQVIISNYIQAASNCVIGTSHYLVCCRNDCEGIVGEIEAKIQGSSAQPDAILSLVGNMTSQTTLDHDEPPHLDKSLKAQLQQIAEGSGGKVPLHGRLFAQWLHYVFPQDCAFPHKAGVASVQTPMEFGENFVASQKEMKEHASSSNAIELDANMGKDDLQWMSQWSPEEELMTDSFHHAHYPWESAGYFSAGAFVLLLLGTFAGIFNLGKYGKDNSVLPTHAKSHFV
mmetsp:Transcript_43167/g.85492  ORF Transcript_43167/g.85492 Transcript_43167/m.85492 type:complete len:573 (-) Transcript_43167:42-1760(-)